MSAAQSSNIKGEVMRGETACGAIITITPETAYIYYRDEIVYFCDQDCKDIYNEDPMSSCMAARLLSGK